MKILCLENCEADKYRARRATNVELFNPKEDVTMYKIEVVENGVQAISTINSLENQGFAKKDIYLFAHDKDRSENLTDATDTSGVGMKEQGVFDSIGNVFRSRGDELRTKMASLGMTDVEAQQYEEVLDAGKLVIVGSNVN